MEAAEALLGAPSVDESRSWGVLVDTAELPDGGQLYLRRHEEDYEILFGEEQLMGSWAFRSEEALATLALRGLGPAARVLVGGLGMGFTLAAARKALSANASIVVAELVPEVVTWAKGPLRHIHGASLADRRVSLVIGDVHDVMIEREAAFDAILLDVDNGPEGLIHLANERLYCPWGLRAARAALRPGGVLAVWSSFADADFTDRLIEVGFDVDVTAVDPDGHGNAPPHTIWLARR
jgi:spermidine synthase